MHYQSPKTGIFRLYCVLYKITLWVNRDEITDLDKHIRNASIEKKSLAIQNFKIYIKGVFMIHTPNTCACDQIPCQGFDLLAKKEGSNMSRLCHC
jgi:hypothetical protein